MNAMFYPLVAYTYQNQTQKPKYNCRIDNRSEWQQLHVECVLDKPDQRLAAMSANRRKERHSGCNFKRPMEAIEQLYNEF